MILAASGSCTAAAAAGIISFETMRAGRLQRDERESECERGTESGVRVHVPPSAISKACSPHALGAHRSFVSTSAEAVAEVFSSCLPADAAMGVEAAVEALVEFGRAPIVFLHG